MKATLLLRKDHEKLQVLFEQFRKASRPGQKDKRAIFEEIRDELTLHSNVENEVFYSALKDSSTVKQTSDLVDTLIDDHRRIERLLQEIDASTGNERLLESKMERLKELVDAHLAREEEDLFSEARHVLSEHRLEELGLEMEQRRRLFTQAAA